jgi:hypothetical protein
VQWFELASPISGDQTLHMGEDSGWDRYRRGLRRSILHIRDAEVRAAKAQRWRSAKPQGLAALNRPGVFPILAASGALTLSCPAA